MRSTYPTIFKADVVPLVSARYDGGGEVYSRPRSYRISWKWRSSATFHVNGRRRCLFLIPVYQVFPSRPRDRGKGKTRSVPWERGSRRGRPRTKPSRGGTSRFGSKCDRSIRAIIDERLAEEKRGGGRKKREKKNLETCATSSHRSRGDGLETFTYTKKSSIAMATRNVTKDIGETKAVTVLWIGRAKTILEVERENNATWDPGGTSP